MAIVICVSAGLYGCTDPLQVGDAFLHKPPDVSGLTKDSVFSDPQLAKQFLWHTYRTLPYGPGGTNKTSYDKNKLAYDLLASLTDINQSYLQPGGAISIYYNAGTGIPYSTWRTKYNYNGEGAWAGIRQSLIFLNNIDQVPDMPQRVKEELKGEARMIIAVHYTDLFRNYGGVPWVNKVYGANSEIKYHPRMKAKAMVDSIVAVIDRAIQELPFTRPPKESGRFTAAGAMGLKCRLLLFAASPLFNSPQPYMSGLAASKKYVWYGGYYPKMWKRAANACHAFILKNRSLGMPYHLVTVTDNSPETEDYRKAFQHAYYDRNSPEILISTRVTYKSPNGIRGKFRAPYYYGNVLISGAGATTDNYVKMFPMANGMPITNPNSGYDPAHPYKNRDPRLYETVVVNGDKYRGRKAQLYIGGKERRNKTTRATRTGYRMRKFVLDGISAFGTVVQYPYLRLPEIYLSYAEALCMVHGHPTAEAYKFVNKVRNRVGLADLQESMTNPNSKEEFIHRVLRERVLELGYEEVRWYDMIRWKMKDVFTKTLYGMNICKKDGSYPTAPCKPKGYGRHESSEYIYTRFKLPERAWKKDFSPKWYLGAFPKQEILKDYGLIQNPGWGL